MTLAEAITERLEGVRRRTLDILEPLGPEDVARPPSPIMSPPVWDMAHIAAYEERWIAVGVLGDEPLHPGLRDVYDAFETPRSRRAATPMLGEREARSYLDRVRERTLEALAARDVESDDDPLVAGGFVFDMVAQHEAQHAETVLQALKLMPPGVYAPPRRAAPAPRREEPGGWVEHAGGETVVGAPDGGFAFDCERPRHACRLAPFAIARDPVSNGDHLAFMADGGYRDPRLWTAEGWAWRLREGVEAPLHWEPDGEGGWLERSYDRIGPVDPEGVLCHVGAHEADAHARWAGGRLPTEREWEHAARGDGVEEANLESPAFGPSVRGARPAGPGGCRQMIGDVWEWTASDLEGYPGFRPFPYREYSETFFGEGHRVLRGGSWATGRIAARPSFRNWDLPERRQVFAGLRLARDAGG